MALNPKTRTGRKVLDYLKAHPDETSPSRVAKETGCDRETARNYLYGWRQQRGNPPPADAAESPAPPPVKAAEPAAESATPGERGRSFDADFPQPTRPAKPAPPPERKPVTAADVDDVDEEPETPKHDVDEDGDGPMGWLF